ncbi:MAG: ferritin-like domain-containing protein, partial [Bdellovibrionota bacterium]
MPVKAESSESIYEIDRWLRACPQGYLNETTYGHKAQTKENPFIFEDEITREQVLMGNAHFVAGERAALAASSGLINAMPDEASKIFLSTQTLDEGRHVEIFTHRMMDLGLKTAEEREAFIGSHVNKNLVKFAEVLLEKVDKKDFVSAITGQNIILEGMAFSVFEFSRMQAQFMDPVGAQVLEGVIADERRHVGFGENRLGKLVKQFPEKRKDIQDTIKGMTHYMVETFRGVLKANATVMREQMKRFSHLFENVEFIPGKKLLDTTPEDQFEYLLGRIKNEHKKRLERLG